MQAIQSDEGTIQFSEQLQSTSLYVIGQHAPIVTKTVTDRTSAPWMKADV